MCPRPTNASWQAWKTPEDLCCGLSISRQTLETALGQTKRYHKIEIERGLGKPARIIFAPRPKLKLLQRRILHSVLDKLPLPDCVHSCRSKSIVSNASIHVGQEAVAAFDMKDFFPSISADRARGVFLEAGFSKWLASLLAQLVAVDDHLQQGPPTSPAIANLVATPLDGELLSRCRFQGLRYSRYVDDITISGDTDAVRGIDGVVREAIERNGFAYSETKYRFMPAAVPQMVTGIIVNSLLEVPPEYETDLIVKMDELVSSASALPRDTLIDDYQKIVGRIEFCRQVSPETGLSLVYGLHQRLTTIPAQIRSALPDHRHRKRARPPSCRRRWHRST